MQKITATAALAVLEDIVNGAIQRERVFRDREDLLAHDDNWLISRFRGSPPGTVRGTVRGDVRGAELCAEMCAELRLALERNTARSHALPVPIQVLTTLGYRGIPEGAGRPIGTVPVDPEPSHASCVGRNYPHVSQVYPIPIQRS